MAADLPYITGVARESLNESLSGHVC